MANGFGCSRCGCQESDHIDDRPNTCGVYEKPPEELAFESKQRMQTMALSDEIFILTPDGIIDIGS